jgi:cell division protein FtsA
MPKFELIAGLDIGATKVSLAIIRRQAGSDEKEFLGCFTAGCEGLSASGAVTDLSKLADAVSSVLSKAQDAVKANVTTAFVNIMGTHIDSENVRGRINLLSKENEISRRDLNVAFQNAKLSAVTYDREILLFVPQNYIVDGQEDIKNPIGLFGSRLEVEYLFITGLVSMIGNLSKAVNMGGLEIEEVVLSGLASSYSSLTQSEKDLGVILVDIGNAASEVTVFTEGVIRYEKVIAAGATELSDALASGLKVKPDVTAKIIKNYCKIVSSDSGNAEEKILIKEISPPKTVTEGELQAIIEPRIKEVLDKIKEAISASNCASMASCGVVLIGGISTMDGLAESAELVFNMPVRVAREHACAQAYGLALYGCQKKSAGGLKRQLSENVLKRAFQSAKDFIYDYF